MSKTYRVARHKTGVRSSGLSMDYHGRMTIRKPCKATQFISMRTNLSKLEYQLIKAEASGRTNKAAILRNLIAVKRCQMQDFAAKYKLY